MSIKSDCANKNLTINCVQELPENELGIVSATKDGVIETNIKAAVRGLVLMFPFSLTHI